MADPANPGQGKPEGDVAGDAQASAEQAAQASAEQAAQASEAQAAEAQEAAEEQAAEAKADEAAADEVAAEATQPAGAAKPARKPRAKKPAADRPASLDEEEAAGGASEADLDEREALATAPATGRAAARTADGAAVVHAKAKYVRTSARKARLVADHLRGKDVEEAQAILAHSPRSVAEAWEKLLKSAVANAEHNHELIGDELKISSITADEGPTIKRFRPRAMGRATTIRKRTSHLSISLTPKER
jgi:ribosomal protein L22